ncbi:hypothetical protein M0802_015891 [Mischocyttarus mexicanus]|nr:hypothetical protein M0802_015891 [Mischocyttarus mexicanus]
MWACRCMGCVDPASASLDGRLSSAIWLSHASGKPSSEDYSNLLQRVSQVVGVGYWRSTTNPNNCRRPMVVVVVAVVVVDVVEAEEEEEEEE